MKNSKIKKAYYKKTNWQQVVQTHTDSFSGTYQAWQRKIIVANGSDVNAPAFSNDATVWPIMKAARVSVQGHSHVVTSANYVSGVALLIYCPQGYTLEDQGTAASTWTDRILIMLHDHPEWVLNYKMMLPYFNYVDGNSTIFNFNLSMSSTLKRNLKTGDSIQLLVVYNSQELTASNTVRNNYVTRCFVKAN